jgi:hypothetical protein
MNTLIPPLLSPSTLYTEQARRDATRIRIYNSVLTQIYNKIRAISKIPENERTLLYIVPEFIPGTPKIDVADCVLYLVWNLRNVGYQVTYTHPNCLFISWKAHDSLYRDHESPWAKTLSSARAAAVEALMKPATVSTAHSTPAPKRAAVAAKKTDSFSTSLSLSTPTPMDSQIKTTYFTPGKQGMALHTAPGATLTVKNVSFV